jgi:hypothetical protein
MAKLVDPTTLVSIPQVAAGYGYSAKYLSQMAKDGKLEAWLVGHTWVTTRECIEAYIRSVPSKKSRGNRKKS